MEDTQYTLQQEMSQRTRLLMGEDAFAALQNSRVAVVGLGGVGGHCAEALARAGVGRLHLVDFDRVAPSNLNRQLVAAKSTLGMEKTQAMAQRIVDISCCEVSVSNLRITAETVDQAMPLPMDFIVDAIDSLDGKLALILFAKEHKIPIVSCMGAGNRLDPMAFGVRDVFETTNCPLARKLRHTLRKNGVESLFVVSSTEIARTLPGQRTIGSLAPVTAAAGLCCAGFVIRRLSGLEQ